MARTAGLVVSSFSGTAALLIFVPLVSRFGAGSDAIQELAAYDRPAKGAGAIAEIHGASSRLRQAGARHTE
jgi:hypothetical protein